MTLFFRRKYKYIEILEVHLQYKSGPVQLYSLHNDGWKEDFKFQENKPLWLGLSPASHLLIITFIIYK